MKPLLLFIFVALSVLHPIYGESADELARKVIMNHTLPPYYVPATGGTEKEKQRYQGIVDSEKYLKDLMLSNDTPEKTRLSFAIYLLNYSIILDFGVPRQAKEEQAILSARLLEISKNAEQGAAANP